MEEHIAIQLLDTQGSIRTQVFAGTAKGKELYVRGLDTGDLPESQVWGSDVQYWITVPHEHKGGLVAALKAGLQERGVNSQKSRMRARKRTCCACCTLSTTAGITPSMSSKPWWRRRTSSTPSGGGEAGTRRKQLKMVPAQPGLVLHVVSNLLQKKPPLRTKGWLHFNSS